VRQEGGYLSLESELEEGKGVKKDPGQLIDRTLSATFCKFINLALTKEGDGGWHSSKDEGRKVRWLALCSQLVGEENFGCISCPKKGVHLIRFGKKGRGRNRRGVKTPVGCVWNLLLGTS